MSPFFPTCYDIFFLGADINWHRTWLQSLVHCCCCCCCCCCGWMCTFGALAFDYDSNCQRLDHTLSFGHLLFPKLLYFFLIFIILWKSCLISDAISPFGAITFNNNHQESSDTHIVRHTFCHNEWYDSLVFLAQIIKNLNVTLKCPDQGCLRPPRARSSGTECDPRLKRQ